MQVKVYHNDRIDQRRSIVVIDGCVDAYPLALHRPFIERSQRGPLDGGPAELEFLPKPESALRVAL